MAEDKRESAEAGREVSGELVTWRSARESPVPAELWPWERVVLLVDPPAPDEPYVAVGYPDAGRWRRDDGRLIEERVAAWMPIPGRPGFLDEHRAVVMRPNDAGGIDFEALVVEAGLLEEAERKLRRRVEEWLQEKEQGGTGDE